MHTKKVRVLAVADPAVYVYGDPRYGILDGWRRLGEEPAVFDILPWAEYAPALARECSSPDPSYDIVMIAGHLWMRDYIESGAVEPLGSYVAALGKDYAYEDILPSVRSELSWNGEPWLLPSFTDGHLVFADTEAAKAAFGGAVPDAVSTYELDAAARRMAAAAGRRPVAMKAHPSEIFLDWLPWLLDEGAEPFDSGGRPLFNEPRGVRSLERYLALREVSLPGSESFGNGEILKAVRSREALMAVSWGGQAAPMFQGNPGLSCIGLKRAWNVTWSFALLRKSSNKEAAFRFLAHVTAPAADKAVGRFAGSPVRESTYSDPSERAACPWYGAQYSLVRNAYALPKFPRSGAAFGVLYDEVSQAYGGRKSPSDALSSAERRILEAGAASK